MLRAFQGSLLGLGGLLLLATLLPLIRTDAWWVRVLDFPRAQIAALLVLVLAAWLGFGGRSLPALGFAAALLLAGGYQLARMLPFTTLAPVEMRAASCEPGGRITVMVANVLMPNRGADALLRIVDEADPDLLLVVETDAWWDGRLRVLDARYPHSVKRPLENTYGMHLFSRLPLRGVELRALVEPDVPSVRAEVQLPGGAWIDFHGVHPRPPKPGQDSGPRDAELLIVGREMHETRHPAIVAGDMNDVAWSSTTSLFKRIGGALDPRVGRGTFATFSAKLPRLLRWPLDHVFATPEFGLAELRLLPHFGSDHLPFLITLCHRPDLAPAQEVEAPDTDDRQRAHDTIRDEVPGRARPEPR